MTDLWLVWDHFLSLSPWGFIHKIFLMLINKINVLSIIKKIIIRVKDNKFVRADVTGLYCYVIK